MESETSYSEYKQFNSSQNSSGLLRFRSAPSSLFARKEEKSEKHGAETQGLTSSFGSVQEFEERKSIANGYSLNPQLPPQYPRNQLGSVNGGYRAQNSLEIDSDLIRQNNPLFSAQTGYGSLRNIGGYGFSGGNRGDLSPSSNRAQASQMEFSSAMPSSTLGMLSRISEVENKTEKLRIGGQDTEYYSPDLHFSSWNHSTKFGDNLSGLKREMDCDDQTLIHDTMGGGPRNRLSHHLSLPKTSSQVAAMENLLQFRDTVPCKLRAKRGCATHPRSIAERVRRTRISERMRTLQELVPNMEKQTNTSDMLDLAVEYIKELQKQYKALSDIRANCKCSAIQKPVSGHKG